MSRPIRAPTLRSTAGAPKRPGFRNWGGSPASNGSTPQSTRRSSRGSLRAGSRKFIRKKRVPGLGSDERHEPPPRPALWRLRPPGNPGPRRAWIPTASRCGSMTVDVQQNHPYWVVISGNGAPKPAPTAHSRLLHFEKIFGDGAIEDLRLRFKILDQSRDVLDCKYNTQSVLQICHRWGYLAVMAVEKHDFLHQDGVRRIYAAPEYVDAFQGKPQQGNLPLPRGSNSPAGAPRCASIPFRRQPRRRRARLLDHPARRAGGSTSSKLWAEILIRKAWVTQGAAGITFGSAFVPTTTPSTWRPLRLFGGSMIGLLGAQSLEQAPPGRRESGGHPDPLEIQ